LSIAEGSAPEGALVIGGGHGALAIARSLGRRGVPVCVIAGEIRLAASSRYVMGCFPGRGSLPSQQQTQYLVEIAHSNRLVGWTLIAGSDAAAELIARHREVLARAFQIVTSPLEAVRDALDKRRSYALAGRVGIEHPLTSYPADADDLMRLEIDYPAIVKPSLKIGWNAFLRAKAWKVRNRDELLRRYREALSMIEPQSIMIQNFIPAETSTSTRMPHCAVTERRWRVWSRGDSDNIRLSSGASVLWSRRSIYRRWKVRRADCSAR